MTMIIALDQSTSAKRCFDARAAVLDKASRNHRQIYPQPGWVEHDADEIWRNVPRSVIIKRNKLNKLAALSITNQRETVLVFERKTRPRRCNALVWQGSPGDAICGVLTKQGHGLRVLKKTLRSRSEWMEGMEWTDLIINRVTAKATFGTSVLPNIGDKLRSQKGAVTALARHAS